MLGLIFVILGVLLLFQEMGIITGDFWGYFWPVIFIVLGISFMNKEKKDNSQFCFWCKPKKKEKDHKVVDEQ